MITIHEAYLKVKAKQPEKYRVLQHCTDYGDFWTFIFGPNRAGLMVGGADGVYKKTGEMFGVGSIALGMDAKFANGVEVPVERVIAESKPVSRATVTRTQRGVTKRAVAAMA